MRARSFVFSLFLVAGLAGCDSGDSSEKGTLEIIDLTAGTGAVVQMGNTLQVRYEGRLADGTVFDSTDERGEAWFFTMVEGQVIEGWLEGLVGIKVGGSRRLVIPPHLAFGRNGQCFSDGSCPVPGNATVTYDVTVEDIVDTVIVEDVQVGTGAVADLGKQIIVDYTGTFLDGRVFDSSGLSGRPIAFTLGYGSVIEGWDRGLVGMKVGGVRNLIIPPHEAYGARGIPGSIPPYTTLRFRVELRSVE